MSTFLLNAFRALTVGVGVYGLWATLYTAAARALASPLAQLSSLVVAASLVALIWFFRAPLSRAALHVGERTLRIPGRWWVLGCLLLGLALRVAWLSIVPVVQTSDHKTYLELARTLYSTGEYSVGGSRAYWPPGLPFALYPLVAVFGDAWFVPALLNSVLFAAALVLVYIVGRDVAGGGTARVAALMLAIWPNFIFGYGLAMKECLVLVALMASVAAYLSADRIEKSASVLRIASGVAFGAAVLAQPSLILLPAAYFFFELLRRSPALLVAKRLLLVAAGMVFVVGPWALRNYLVLDTFVPVSNTGGISLLVGNNPNATGAYVDIRDLLPPGDEVAVNQEAGRIAREWIRDNPGRFIELIYRKNVILLGDDSSGAYFSLNHALGIDDWRYALAKGACNAYWMLVLSLLILSSMAVPNGDREQQARMALMVLPLLYALAIHSVFESGSRHHAPLSALLAIAAAGVCSRYAAPAEARRQARPIGGKISETTASA